MRSKIEFTEAVQDADLTTYEKVMLYTVAGHYNWKNEDACYAGQTRLALEAGMKRTKANTTLKSLKEQGWLVSEGLRKDTSTELLVPVIPANFARIVMPERRVRGDSTEADQGVVHDVNRGCSSPEQGVFTTRTGVVHDVNRNSEENSEENSEVNSEEEIAGVFEEVSSHHPLASSKETSASPQSHDSLGLSITESSSLLVIEETDSSLVSSKGASEQVPQPSLGSKSPDLPLASSKKGSGATKKTTGRGGRKPAEPVHTTNGAVLMQEMLASKKKQKSEFEINARQAIIKKHSEENRKPDEALLSRAVEIALTITEYKNNANLAGRIAHSRAISERVSA